MPEGKGTTISVELWTPFMNNDGKAIKILPNSNKTDVHDKIENCQDCLKDPNPSHYPY